MRSVGGLSVTEFARRLGVSRVVLSRVVNGRKRKGSGGRRSYLSSLAGQFRGSVLCPSHNFS